jgi:hypothetical protein
VKSLNKVQFTIHSSVDLDNRSKTLKAKENVREGKNLVYDSRCNSIDYRCEYGRFPVSKNCVKMSNPDSLSSSGTWVNPGIRS